MDALILAAGDGTRLYPLTKDTPKVMIKIFGIPILERTLHVLKNVGIERVVIIIGHNGDKIRNYFGNEWYGMNIIYEQSNWTGDGILRSTAKAKGVINKRFIFLSGDTIPEEKTLRKGLEKGGDVVISVRSPSKDDSVVAKVDKNGKVTNVSMRGKAKNYNVSIPGITICEPSFLEGVEGCINDNKFDRPDAIKWMLDNGYSVNSFDVTEDTLIEIDTPEDLKRAKKIIFDEAWKKRLKKEDINIFKKLFNWPISFNLTKLLVKLPITPNQITIFYMCTGILAGILFSQGYFVMGGIFCYFSAMLDAVDGKISRLKLKSSLLGSYFDSITDRVVESAIVLGLAYGIYRITNNPLIFALGFLGVFGWLSRFYVKELFLETFRNVESSIWRKFKSSKINLLGDRDFNFFIVMLACLIGYPLVGLIYLAISPISFLIWRFIQTTALIKKEFKR